MLPETLSCPMAEILPCGGGCLSFISNLGWTWTLNLVIVDFLLSQCSVAALITHTSLCLEDLKLFITFFLIPEFFQNILTLLAQLNDCVSSNCSKAGMGNAKFRQNLLLDVSSDAHPGRRFRYSVTSSCPCCGGLEVTVSHKLMKCWSCFWLGSRGRTYKIKSHL